MAQEIWQEIWRPNIETKERVAPGARNRYIDGVGNGPSCKITSKGEGNKMKFVKTAEGKGISTTHKTLGELSLDVEVPQVESLDEFVSFAGGNEQALGFINKSISDDAKAQGRTALKAIPDGSDVDAAKSRIQGIVKNYTPQAADGREVRAKKVAAFDTLQNAVNEKLAKGEELSVEELLEMLAKAK